MQSIVQTKSVASESIPYNEAESGSYLVGNYEVAMSQSAKIDRDYLDLAHLNNEKSGSSVWIRARIFSVRGKGNSVFFVLRELGNPSITAQACYFKKKDENESKAMLKFMQDISLESIVDIKGLIVDANVRSCTITQVEIQIEKFFVVARAPRVLPFLIEDAGHSQAEIEESKDSERPLAGVSLETRLDHRWLDLRTPATNAIFKIRASITKFFRSTLDERGFTEIQSPKLIAGESESGAGVFTTDYFGEVACLAQSPQLYKQMAIAGDLLKVYEIGPVFRAENSNTRRHLCEFTGLDFEMVIQQHYEEAIRTGYYVFAQIFSGIENDPTSKEALATIRAIYPNGLEPPVIPDEPIIIHFAHAVQLLQDDGDTTADQYADLTTAQEIRLGQLVKKLYNNTDFFVVDQYPANIRPFYTMPCPHDSKLSNSYDFFLRGQEICSGAQRCHDPDILKAQLLAKGITSESKSLQAYTSAFDHVAPPHAGCGFGLDRVVFLYLGLDNIRQASLFPRDPRRCAP